MGIMVKKGDLLPLKDMKHGTSEKGTAWCMVPASDESGKNRLTLWAENAEETAKMTGKAKVKEIITVKNSNRKDKQGNWQKDVSATVIFERPSEADFFAQGSFAQQAFDAVPEVPGSNPFGETSKTDGNPFDGMPFN